MQLKILILTGNGKKEYEIGFYNQLKEAGYNVGLASISSVIVKTGLKTEVLFKGKNILNSYNFFIPFIDDRYLDLFKFVLDEINKKNFYSLISGRALYYYSNYLHFLNLMSNSNILVPVTLVAKSKKIIENYLENIRYPVLLKIPDQKSEILVKSRESLSSILDTIEVLKKPLIIQEMPDSYERLKIMMLGSNAYGVKVDSSGESYKFTLNKKLKKDMEKISRVIDSKLFAIKGFLDDTGRFYVDDLILKPDFEFFLNHYPKLGTNFIKELSKERGMLSYLYSWMRMFQFANKSKEEMRKKLKFKKI
ncbi:MAG: hypothetical protein GXN99_03455 [Candidatus Nanohaloarchaeota archaeon]|nr:hypothetical protein [Candidatus Nanohaloarchaeota archaeon]